MEHLGHRRKSGRPSFRYVAVELIQGVLVATARNGSLLVHPVAAQVVTQVAAPTEEGR